MSLLDYTPAEPLIVYTKSQCGQCDSTKSVLDRKEVHYIVRNVEDPEHPEYMEEALATGLRAMPIVVTPDGDSWGGFRPDLITKYQKDLALQKELVGASA